MARKRTPYALGTVLSLLALTFSVFGCAVRPPEQAGPAPAPSVGPAITAPAPATLTPPGLTASPTPPPAPEKGSARPDPTKPAQGTAKQNGRIALGYYVSYDSTSWASLQAHADALDYVALQIISPDACGNIASESDLTLLDFAHSRGVRVLPSIYASSKWLNHGLLTDAASTSRLVQELTGYVVDLGYDGLDVDLEDVEPSDRKALTALMARLSESLHQKGKMLAMAVPAKSSDVTTGWAGAYDYAALAPHVDLFTIMTYAYTTSSTPPGSTAPVGWVDKVTEFATSQISPRKVLVGVPFYGYDWNVTSGGLARALRYPQAAALASRYGATIATDPSSKSARFEYSAGPGDQPVADDAPPAPNHVSESRTRPPCPAQPPTPAPKPTQKPSPVPTTVQGHVVWLEDAASVRARIDLVDKHGAGGIGAWRLGQEDPKVWPLLKDWRR